MQDTLTISDPASHRPSVTGERRRVKIAGLALIFAAGPAVAWLSEATAHAGWLDDDPAALALMAIVFVVCANVVTCGLLVLAAGFGQTHFWREPRVRRAALLKLVGANVLVPGLLFSLLQDDRTAARWLDDDWISTTLVALALGLIVYGAAVLRRGWRYEAASADEAMRLDARPPVIYLRSFSEDGAMSLINTDRVSRWMGSVSATSAEQELAFILRRIGPVIAIGKPGEPLPELGAARLYVDHQHWQQTVIALLQRAALVALRVGVSAGVQWEIEQTLANVPRQRVIFLLLGDGEDAELAARHLGGLLGAQVALPSKPVGLRRMLAAFVSNPRRRLGAVVCFDVDGLPIVEPIRALPTRKSDLALMLITLRQAAGPLRDAFRRVFAHLGLPWQQGKHRGVAITLALLAGGVGAHWFYVGRRRRALAYLLGFALAVPFFLAWFEAVRWVLMDRQDFEQRVLRNQH